MGRTGKDFELKRDVERFFATDGPLARRKPGYVLRPEQVRFALEVAETLEGGRVLLGECPTGLGKSLGYLVPICLSADRAVVSTATIVLQNQLLVHDLPLLDDCVREFTGGERGVSFGLLKGRGNFLCESRLEGARRSGALFGEEYEVLERLGGWALEEAATGDREDLPFPVSPSTWRGVAADADDCVPKKCSYRERCFYFARREEVSSAQVVVVNHALLLANAACGYNAFDMEDRHLVLDEGHRVEHVMSEAFGSHVSRTRVGYACRAVSRRAADAGRYTEDVETAADLFFDALNSHASVGRSEQQPPHFDRLQTALSSLTKILRSNPREEVNKLADMVHRLYLDLASFYGPLRETHTHAVLPARRSVGAKGRSAGSRYPELKSWLVDTQEFCEAVAERGEKATVLASATLTAGGSFGYVRHRLGLEDEPFNRDVREFRGLEAFDYRQNCLIYAARDIPEPKAGEAYVDACIARSEKLVALSGGRTLIVLTTWRALNRFRERFAPEGLAVRFQGDDTPSKLARWLKETEGAVLVGTGTYREGIDVPGSALSLVILDKAPFPPPDDPLVGALSERAGKRWFSEVSMPRAQIAMRQGAGRLIRTSEDRGVVAILDPRIVAKGWGKVLLGALPPARRTTSLAAVEAFFAAELPSEVPAQPSAAR